MKSISISFPRIFNASALLLCVLLCLPGLGTAGSVTLEWDANKEADLAGYRIYYGKAPRGEEVKHPKQGSQTYPKMADAGKVTRTAIQDLEEGTEYFFAATAYDKWGNESDFSEEISDVVGPVGSVRNMRIVADQVNISITAGK